MSLHSHSSILSNQLDFEKKFDPMTSVHIFIDNNNIINLEEPYIDLSKYKKLKKLKICYEYQKIKFINYPECLNYIFCIETHLDLTNLTDNIRFIIVCYSKYSDDDFLNLPTYLLELKCSHNKIKKLDNLPTNLILLDCSKNFIICLNYLPESLVTLYCSNNKLISLDNLPRGLKFLSCDHNEIILLNSLPDSLEQVFAKSNLIESIDRLPKSLTRANFTSNPIIKTPKCANSLLLLNYSLDAEKASMLDKTIQLGYKLTYGSYHTAKYIGYGIGYTGFAIGVTIAFPFAYTFLKLIN